MLLLFWCFSLSGCAFLFDRKVDDYAARSTIYGWFDLEEAAPNRIDSMMVYQHRPRTDRPEWYMELEKVDNGYLFYSHIVSDGAFKVDSIAGRRCYFLFFCDNATYRYSLGKQGDAASVVIEEPGVYYVGSYELKDTRPNFLGPGKFEIKAAENPPSKKRLLEFMVENAPAKRPVIGERLKTALEAQ